MAELDFMTDFALLEQGCYNAKAIEHYTHVEMQLLCAIVLIPCIDPSLLLLIYSSILVKFNH